MDLFKSHISGWFFLHPVPCSPLYSSIFLQLSWGFLASDCVVYISPGKDVSTTDVSQDTTQGGHFNSDQEALKSTGTLGKKQKNLCLLLLPSSSAFIWPPPPCRLRPWTQLRWWLFWLCSWRWLASARLFSSKVVWTKMTSCQAAQRRTWLTTCWGWWDEKPLTNFY